MDLNNINQIEQATQPNQSELFRLGIGFLFVIMIMMFTGSSYADVPGGFMLIIAAMIGGYMAMNIGANDVPCL